VAIGGSSKLATWAICIGKWRRRQDWGIQKDQPRRNITEKMTFRKYDPFVRKHAGFKEAKIK
jgi:ribosomal protein L33